MTPEPKLFSHITQINNVELCAALAAGYDAAMAQVVAVSGVGLGIPSDLQPLAAMLRADYAALSALYRSRAAALEANQK